jgi:ribosome-binding ATPase YchF (GTP1/OBG family)
VKIGIVGIPNAGKSSLFSARTGVAAEATQLSVHDHRAHVAVAPVAEPRLDV